MRTTYKFFYLLLVFWTKSDVVNARTTKNHGTTESLINSEPILDENYAITTDNLGITVTLNENVESEELNKDVSEGTKEESVTEEVAENSADTTDIPENSIHSSTSVNDQLTSEEVTENVAITSLLPSFATPIPDVAETQDLSTSSNVELLFTSPTEDELFSELNKQVTISYSCPVNHSMPCVPKCCNLNESHANFSIARQNRTECVLNTEDDFWLTFADCPNYGGDHTMSIEERYEYYIGIPCTSGKYILDPAEYPEDIYSLNSNGSLFYAGKYFSMSDYCVDNVDGEIRVFVCFESTLPDSSMEFYHILYPVGQLLSIPFLLATAVTYLAIEKFRDLQGKSLVCHVLSLAVAFFFLALVQLSGPDLNQTVCTTAAFIIQFSFVACFFWLNVLSYDVYRNINDDFRTAYNKGSIRSEKRKFIMYSLYAWNGPMILLIVSLVLDTAPNIPDSLLKPDFGVTSCWFSSEAAALPYFFGPVGILISINLVFFTLSAYTIWKEKNADAAEALNKAREDDDGQKIKKKRRKLHHLIKGLKQCFKLFIIMGISWLAEIISWAIGGSRYIWVTTDVINTLQGVLIFIVYVYQPERIRSAVWKRLTRFWGILTHCNCAYRPSTQLPQRIPAPVPTVTRDQIELQRVDIPLTTFAPE